MSNIDEFTGKSLVYSRYRQKYPEAVINYMISKCKLSGTSTIIDVGCGTGILTKQLLDKGINTIGVEPNIDMYNQAKIYLESYKTSIINSSAEGTNLPDNCADLVTVAQALHWFELKKFRCEYMRILKDSGRVAILYNNADEYNAAVRDFYALNIKNLVKKLMIKLICILQCLAQIIFQFVIIIMTNILHLKNILDMQNPFHIA